LSVVVYKVVTSLPQGAQSGVTRGKPFDSFRGRAGTPGAPPSHSLTKYVLIPLAWLTCSAVWCFLEFFRSCRPEFVLNTASPKNMCGIQALPCRTRDCYNLTSAERQDQVNALAELGLVASQIVREAPCLSLPDRLRDCSGRKWLLPVVRPRLIEPRSLRSSGCSRLPPVQTARPQPKESFADGIAGSRLDIVEKPHLTPIHCLMSLQQSHRLAAQKGGRAQHQCPSLGGTGRNMCGIYFSALRIVCFGSSTIL
jgi:hypothetical protein